jgi:hypothetical protein
MERYHLNAKTQHARTYPELRKHPPDFIVCTALRAIAWPL